jgi:NADPH-dependent 2,4-dienoyl-CoA reductase/sulfur reductase-like enzyme/rhodanese-related sulfurtransferase
MAQQVVFIGGVALGSKAACRFKRLEPESRAVVIDADRFVSYGGCGIPYYVSGDVSDISELRTTSFHMVRDEKFFRECKDIELMTETRATRIDRPNKTVQFQKADGTTGSIAYDKLVIGTGSMPRPLPLKGLKLGNVHSVGNLHDAAAIKALVVQGAASKAVVIGGGFIGLEMAEALADMWEVDTTVVELCDQIMPGFVSPGFARMAQRHMEEKGVHFRLGERVTGMEGEAGIVRRVVTERGALGADLVILAAGVVPNTGLAWEAGLEIGPAGIVVNDRLQTSDPDIYAGGDCAQIRNLISGQPAFYPLGSMANRQGRVIGTNLAGGDACFPGAVGSFVVKVFDHSLAGAGLTVQNARKAGFDAVGVQVAQLDRAHFYPTKEMMHLELVVERSTRRVLGIQGFGSSGDAMVGRVNAVAAILDRAPTVDAVSNLELAYSPPFSSAMDILNALGNAADNLLAGRYHGLSPEEFEVVWKGRDQGGGCLILDCRAREDGKALAEKYPDLWLNIPQDELRRRIDEIPSDKDLILVCNTGVRSYEAQLNLRQLGREKNRTLQGGVVSLKKSGVEM